MGTVYSQSHAADQRSVFCDVPYSYSHATQSSLQQKIQDMGLVYADIELISSDDMALFARGYLKEGQVRRVKIRALVDTGAYFLCINENIRDALGLRKQGEQIAELADGSRVKLDVVGPIELRFENRRVTTEGLVLPGDSEVLLGAIPLEAMDVVIEPRLGRLIVNPEHPDSAVVKLKRA